MYATIYVFIYFIQCIQTFFFADAMSTSKIVEQLSLNKLVSRKWYVQAACATTGEGIYEGMHQLASMVKEFKKESHRPY